MPVQHHTVSSPEEDQRLDRWFRQRFPALGQGRLEKLLRTGQVRVDGKRINANHRLTAGEVIRIPPMPEGASKAARTDRKPTTTAKDAKADKAFLESITLYRDDAVLVLNKPAGLAVQGGSKQKRSLDGMLRNFSRSSEQPRLVHRLDKDTSGVIAVGLTRQATAAMAKSFRARDVRKLYWAIVAGTPDRRRGFIDFALAKRGGPAGERVFVAEALDEAGIAHDAQHARTRYAVVDHAANQITWLAMMPLTGRTHQLRAHTSAIGTPIIGDGKYGGSDAFVTGLSRKLHLHARRLIAPHPGGGWIDAEATLSTHMQETFDSLGFDVREDDDPFDLSER